MPKIVKKLKKELPKLPGVYFFKNTQGEILYIGKAKNLHDRVNSYFQKQPSDWKIKHLIEEYEDLDYILTKTEIECLLLEAQLIQKYKPPFNVLLKEGQPFLYILFTRHPSTSSGRAGEKAVKLVRNKKAKGIYVGPFLEKAPARKTYHFIMRTFKLNLCNKKLEHGCLDYHIGNCAGNCKADFDSQEYNFRVQLAYDTLKNNQRDFIQKIKQQMSIYAAQLTFEKAQKLNEYLHDVDRIFATINTHFTEQKFATEEFVISTPTPYIQHSSTIHHELQHFLNSKTPIHTIDCFDVSHFQSSHIVGSCVRFTDGKPDKNMFRRFKIKTLQEQNDYASLQEIVSRRYKSKNEYPDLIVIDGGKGQLSAVQHILPEAPNIVSLAKKEEILYGKQFPDGIHLDVKTPVGKLIIALRDYAHHFAISYHRLKKKKEITNE